MNPKIDMAIVDDDLEYLKSFKEYIEMFFASEVKIFSSSEDFLQQIAKHALLCDILILDLDLRGDIPGFLVLPKIKKILPHIKVIIITAYATWDEIRILKEKGANDVLIKPIDADLLKKYISRNGFSIS